MIRNKYKNINIMFYAMMMLLEIIIHEIYHTSISLMEDNYIQEKFQFRSTI